MGHDRHPQSSGTKRFWSPSVAIAACAILLLISISALGLQTQRDVAARTTVAVPDGSVTIEYPNQRVLFSVTTYGPSNTAPLNLFSSTTKSDPSSPLEILCQLDSYRPNLEDIPSKSCTIAVRNPNYKTSEYEPIPGGPLSQDSLPLEVSYKPNVNKNEQEILIKIQATTYLDLERHLSFIGYLPRTSEKSENGARFCRNTKLISCYMERERPSVCFIGMKPNGAPLDRPYNPCHPENN